MNLEGISTLAADGGSALGEVAARELAHPGPKAANPR